MPLTSAMGHGWRLGLGVWAALAVVAIVPWLGLVRDRSAAARPAPAGTRPATDGNSDGNTGRIIRSRTAWALACFFGLQATAAYVTMGWMPQIFRDAGLSAGTAGALLAVTMVMGVPLSFALPSLAGRMRHQGPLVVVLALFGLAGYTGLWLAPAGAPGCGRCCSASPTAPSRWP